MPTRTRDRRRRRRGEVKARKVETWYAAQLRQIAREVGRIVNGYPPGDPDAMEAIERVLEQYADTLNGWATRTGAQMIAEVNQRDRRAWAELAGEMSAELRRELREGPSGALVSELLAEQVTLIRSIPLEAAERVHRLTLESIEDSSRAREIAAEIQRSGEVAESRANLIARTEVARTASVLTEARALNVGSEGYIWRTSGDGDVRQSHKEMNGKFVRWDSPPTLSDGTTTHAGQIYNCRCYPEPVIPD